MIGDLEVTSLDTEHDCADPVMFLVKHGNVSVAVATDLGEIDETIAPVLRSANVAVLESNYDEDILAANEYNDHHKERVRGGHLSNEQACEYIVSAPEHQKIVLIHISQRSDSARLVAALHKKDSRVYVMGSRLVFANLPYICAK